MQEFKVKVTQELQGEVTVKAEDIRDATIKVKKMYDDGSITLDKTNFNGNTHFVTYGTIREELLIAYDASVIANGGKDTRHVSNTALVTFTYNSLSEFGDDYQTFKNSVKQHIVAAAAREMNIDKSSIFVSFEVYEIIGRKVIDEEA